MLFPERVGDRHRGAVHACEHFVAATVAFAATLTLLAACTNDTKKAAPANDTTPRAGGAGVPAAPGTLRVAIVGDLSLDPAATVLADPAGLLAIDLLYDTLTTYPKGLSGTGDAAAMAPAAEPALAASLTPNAEATTWTVSLRDRRFSNGTRILAQDVKATLERLAAPGDTSLAGARLEIIDGYEALASGATDEMSGLRVVDDRTLEIVLRESYAQLPELLSSPAYGVVPANVATDGAVVFDQRIASGPYHVVSTTGSITRLEPSPNYEQRGGPDAVELVSFASWDDAFVAFQTGGVDWSLVPSSSAPGAATEKGAAFSVFGSTEWFGLNVANPALADQRFRTAIVRAVDSEKVVADALTDALALRSIVPRGVPGFDATACRDLCTADRAEAARLAAEAFPDGNVPTVPIDVFDDPAQLAMAEAISGQLAAAGIPAEVRVKSFTDYQAFITSQERGLFTFATIGVAPIQDVFLAPPFVASSADNATGIASAEIDTAARAARALRDPGAREAAYRALERQVLATGAILPIAQLRTNQMISARVQGWSTRLDGTVVIEAVTVAR